MHPGTLLDLASDLLRRVRKFDAPADAVVSAFFREHRQLGQRERATLAETTYCFLRKRLLFEYLSRGGSGVIERRLAILGWAGSEMSLLGVLAPPERAWFEQTKAVDRASLPESLRHNLPDWLAQALRDQLGADEFWHLVAALYSAAPLDLRVNTLKAKRDDVRAALREAGVQSEPTRYSPWGLRVGGKPAIGRLDVFTRGDIEVQDEGSQLLALLTDARRGEMVVDFCAGSGGKTLALGAAMRDTGRLYAFDTSAHRLDALKPRLARSGLSNVYPTQITHERDERIQRLHGKTDRVLVDVPCSGLGTLRRNPDLKWRQTPQSIDELRVRQLAILTSAAHLLKSGGRLVYATCSLLRAENEQVVSEFDAACPEFGPMPVVEVLARARCTDAESVADGRFLHLWPHRHGSDGFFAAVWVRK